MIPIGVVTVSPVVMRVMGMGVVVPVVVTVVVAMGEGVVVMGVVRQRAELVHPGGVPTQPTIDAFTTHHNIMQSIPLSTQRDFRAG